MTSPTQQLDHTLDLVVTRSDVNVHEVAKLKDNETTLLVI